MLSRWRQITALLMSHTYSTTGLSTSDPRRRNIDDLTEALDVVLSPIVSRMHDASRKQDLESLIVRAAHYGWLLFSQPTAWMFDWEDGSAGAEKAGQLVVLPALVQTGDEQGRVHKAPRVFSEAQVVEMG